MARRNSKVQDRQKAKSVPDASVDIQTLLRQALEANVSESPDAPGSPARGALVTLSGIAKKKTVRKQVGDALDALGRARFYSLLSHEDPKVRKNVAVLLGTLADARDVDALESAHRIEEYGYVRASLILALGNLPGTASYLSSIGLNGETAHPDEKHALSLVLSRLASLRHPFVALPGSMDIVLSTVPGFEHDLDVQARSLGLDSRVAGSGQVTVATADYPSLFRLRAFSEALFPVACGIELDPSVIAGAILERGVPELLGQMHASGGPFGFRIEIRSLDHATRGKLAASLSMHMGVVPELVNSPSNYSVEFRIIPLPEGKCDVYFKLYSFEDTRFDYRKADVPASIAPSTAAAIMLRCRGRMDPSHDVLDPFCGSGTMLFERLSLLPARRAFGVDISKSAIGAAKQNASGAFDAAFIHSDALAFKPRRPLGELYANMPFGLRSLSHAQNIRLYKDLIDLLTGWLAPDGFAALLTMEKRLFRDLVSPSSGLRIVNEWPVESGKLTPSLFLVVKA